jgi:restriction endonuclease S subunit
VGSTSKHITLGDLQGIEIPLPSAAQQDDFVSRVSELESAFEMARQHVGSLANLKRQHLETALNFNAGSS